MNTKLLRQKILDLAIRGKLTEQKKSDGTTKDLLKQIFSNVILSNAKNPAETAKSSRVILSKRSASKDLAKEIIPLDKSEAPFEIPENWEWVRLGDVGVWQAGTTPSKANALYYKGGTIPWLNTGDLTDGLVTDIPKMVTEKALKETSLKMNEAGSVCIAMYGATIGKLGILNIPATTNQACCVCNERVSFVEQKWLFYFLMLIRRNLLKRDLAELNRTFQKKKLFLLFSPFLL
nr:restriction endonuclease subunit S [Fibrobacter sp. UWH9]